MKKRIIAAAIVATATGVVYPFMEQAATVERGYTAIGGEEALFVFGIFLAIYILIGGFSEGKKKSGNRKATAPQTESEQSESKSL